MNNEKESLKLAEKKLKSSLDFQIEQVRSSSPDEDWIKIPVNDRFLVDALNAAGFEFQTSINEFIDNSIDANSTKIIIRIKKEKSKLKLKSKDDFYNIEIVDNGVGMSNEKMHSIISLGSGELSDYKTNSISHFGVGLKYALKNLTDGITKITSVQNNIKSILYIDTNDVPKFKFLKSIYCNDNNGTTISIPNVKLSSNHISGLSKNLGVTYFPHIHNGNELEILLELPDKNVDVIFTDPIYRNINPNKTFSGGINPNDDCVFIDDYKISIRGRFFSQSFNADDYTSWDKQQGTSSFSGKKSGVYFRLGGRYITLGNNYFLSRSTPSGANKIRIEIEIDKALIKTMGIGFNKSKISIDYDKDELKEFLAKYEEVFTWCVQRYIDSIKDNPIIQTEDEKKERNEIDRDINAMRRKFPLDPDIFSDIPENKTPIIPSSSDKQKKERKKSPEGYDKNKNEKDNEIEIKFASGGSTDRIYRYEKCHGVLTIIYNTDHKWYNYYSKQSKETKKVFDSMNLSYIDSILITRYNHRTDEFDSIINDLLLFHSNRLMKYMND